MPELHIELDVSALVDVPDEQIAGVEARIREEAQAYLRTLTGYGMAVTKLRAETWTAYVAPKLEPWSQGGCMKQVRPALGREHEQAYNRRVGQQLREIRESLGLSRAQFGDALGVSRWTIIYAEEGRPKGVHRDVPLTLVARACALAGVPLSRFKG